ncbi:hypothetical protein ACIGCK_12495 [Microbacterium sp. NPDC078428]|uniref:hypothetical protein n=1 Tax=Microbacterium sp. NPDC078428 TaxID=3364190 RepID=UPI0037C9D1E3
MPRKLRNPQKSGPLPVPVTLPLVAAAVQEDGSITVTVDGVMLMQGPIERDALGRVLSAIAEDKRSPIRAEVHEADGHVFADIITPPPPRSRFAPPPATSPVPPPVPAVRRPALVEVSGQGFVPGEDVAVLVIVAHTSAAGTGLARAILEQERLPDDVRDVLLFGEVSGTIVRQGVRP